MQANESLRPHFTERINKPVLSVPESTPHKDKEKSWIEKLGTSFSDLGRDLGTANQMAKDKFDGDSALLHSARGGMTTLIGFGLDAALDDVLSKGVKQGEVWIGRQNFKLGKDVVEQLAEIGENNPRLRNFIESASQNFITGLAYNTMAYFSGHTLPSVEPKHLLSSLVASATEAMGPKGLEKIENAKVSASKSDYDRMVGLLANQMQEKQRAINAIPTRDVAMTSERARLLEELKNDRKRLNEDWVKAREKNTRTEIMDEILPRVKSKRQIRKERRATISEINARAKAAGIAADERLVNAAEDFNIFKLIIGEDYPEALEAYKRHIGSTVADENTSTPDVDTVVHAAKTSRWKAEAQKILKFANPATILGLDWMVDGIVTLEENFRKVRKVRKDKGGLAGKTVEMPKNDDKYKPKEWRNQRGKYENKGKWQGNKDTVYYGKSNWQQPKEEEVIEKFD